MTVSSIYPYQPYPAQPEEEIVTEVYEYDEKGNVIKMTRTTTKKHQPYVYPTTWTCDVTLRDQPAVDPKYIYNNVKQDTISTV
jgi:hypothetical protein